MCHYVEGCDNGFIAVLEHEKLCHIPATLDIIFFSSLTIPLSVLRIRDILIRIRIRGSEPLTNGFGSDFGSGYFRQRPSR
jgi:hypothetical protein